MNKADFIELVQANRKIIYKICHIYCPDKQDHPDLEQEIYLQLWRSRKRYDGRVKLSTWLYRVALNTAISFYHRNMRHKNLSMSSPEKVAGSYSYEQDDQQQILDCFINELTGLDKALILLFLEGKKYKEIAEVLGITSSNVSSRIFRIKGAFKAKLKKLRHDE